MQYVVKMQSYLRVSENHTERVQNTISAHNLKDANRIASRLKTHLYTHDSVGIVRRDTEVFVVVRVGPTRLTIPVAELKAVADNLHEAAEEYLRDLDHTNKVKSVTAFGKDEDDFEAKQAG